MVAPTAGVRFLHSPGPSHVPLAVMAAMNQQPVDLGDPRLFKLIERCETGLKTLVETKTASPLMYAANGHGAWEAAISNLLQPGERIVVANSGYFSEAWAMHTEGFGIDVVRTSVEDGAHINYAQIHDILLSDTEKKIKAVFAVQTDTASGVTSDIQKIRDAIDSANHPALLVVDVVASLGAAPFEMDKWGVNVAIGASQKALMLPPGLSFTVVDEKALRAAANNPLPRVYWDWGRRNSDLLYRKFCGTPPQNMLMGLEVALDRIEREGLLNVFSRHRRIMLAVHSAVNRWSAGGALHLFVKQASVRSASVTPVSVSSSVDPEKICAISRSNYQVALTGGVGPQFGKMFRIGHLGDINEPMIIGCLGGIEGALRELRIPIGDGALEGAVASLTNRT